MLLMLALPMPAPSGSEESGWMEGIRRRDSKSLSRLYDRYGRQVYALALRMVRNPGVAEDLVQETFLRVWNRAHLFQSERGSPAGWILAIARRLAIDYLRSAEGKVSVGGVDPELAEGSPLWRDWEADVLDATFARRIREAFTKLDENQRMVLELAYFEGLTQSEMAERTRQPLGTVKTWVRRGLQALRKELGEVVPA